VSGQSIGKKRGRKKGVKISQKQLAGMPRTHKKMRGPNILESFSVDDLTEEQQMQKIYESAQKFNQKILTGRRNLKL